MRRLVLFITGLLLLLTRATSSYAQPTTKGEAKSLVGIEVHFRFDNSGLDLSYMGNERALTRFAHVIDSLGLHTIDSVVILSQSSPEGVYLHNVSLSRQRAATMREVIEQRHPELSSRLYVHPDGESWAQLRAYVKSDRQMKQATIDKVISIIDDTTIGIDTKKWRLEHLPIYRYLRATYFPRIRNSVFCIIYFDDPIAMAQLDELLPTSSTRAEVEDITLPSWPIVQSSKLTAQSPQLKAHSSQPTAHSPLLNVRTNLLYDLGTVLNVGIEYYPRHPRWSILAHYTFPWWSNDTKHQYLQLLDWQMEARYYLQRAKRHAGWYAAPYVHWNLYDISIDAERGWQGEGKGMGLSFGHVRTIGESRRWKMDCFVRLGYYQTLFDPYHASDPYNGKYYYDWPYMPEDFVPRNHRLQLIGPTGAGVTFSYELFRRKLKVKN